MAAALKWKNRPAMIRRGKRILKAHWRNRTLDLEDRVGTDCILETWFQRNVHRYAATVYGPKVKETDMRQMAKQFWRDVMKELENWYRWER